MEVKWHWPSQSKVKENKNILKKEVNYYELWKIWWTICTTRIKKRIK